MKKSRFGMTKDGVNASVFTIMNKNGMGMEVTDYGATLVAVTLPDKNQRTVDVLLGYDDVVDYENNGGCLGATVGRNANRIGGAVVTINGKRYELEKNEGENSLHSGTSRYNRRVWDVETDEENGSIRFRHHSADKDQGFPGNFDVSVTYTLTDENEVKIHYEGICDADTIVNMTNHSYFNLAGHESGSVLEQLLQIHADRFTVVGEDSIPTGELRAVEGTPFDFREMKEIGRDIEADDEQIAFGGGYDHNLVLNNPNTGVRKVAEAYAKATGITMEVYTDCVGVQLYTGNGLKTTMIGKDGVTYEPRCGFCLETQGYPDAPNHENFESTILRAGEKYDTTTIYKFFVR